MYVIFTDLDGTLLDYDTYSFERVEEVLGYIREQKIPLVAVTSKTAEEVKQIIRDIGISHPFAVENGGCILFPEDYPGNFNKNQKTDDYFIVPVTQSHIKLTNVLEAISKNLGIRLQGLSNMTVEEVVSFTGLSAEEALKAQQRYYSEPFLIPSDKSILKKIIRLSDNYNFKIVRGGRFAHLIPKDSGKEIAVKYLINFYQKLYSGIPLISVGLGDSPNDYDFLSITDISVLIRNQEKIPRFAKKNWIISKSPGTAGWADEVKKIICP